METTRRIEVNKAPISPPETNKPVQVTLDGVTHEFWIVRAERNYDGTWDLTLEAKDSVGLMPGLDRL